MYWGLLPTQDTASPTNGALNHQNLIGYSINYSSLITVVSHSGQFFTLIDHVRCSGLGMLVEQVLPLLFLFFLSSTYAYSLHTQNTKGVDKCSTIEGTKELCVNVSCFIEEATPGVYL